MDKALAADVATAVGLGVSVGRFRAEIAAAEPALERLRALGYPSSGMLASDVSGTFEALDYLDESVVGMAASIEVRPLEVDVISA